VNRRGRILLVEDDAVQRRRLVEALAERYVVAESESGEDCLARAPDFQPDVILLDVVLGGIDGVETCRALRHDDRLRHTRIVMVSSRDALPDRMLGYEAGAQDYIAKPFDLDELHAKLEVLLRLRSDSEVHDLKSQFLSLMAHETRTPLTGIVGPAEVLACEGLKEEDRIGFARMILESAQRLEDLVDKASELCAIRAGNADHDPIRLHMADLVHAALHQLEILRTQKEIEVEVEAPAQTDFEGDPDQIALLVRTLIERALRVSPESSALRVAVEAEDDEVRLLVMDRGEPLDPEQVPTLFDDFHVPSVDTHTGSLGLDLALSGALTHAHRGMIEVQSSGEGNTFVVRLPRQESSRISGQLSPADLATLG